MFRLNLLRNYTNLTKNVLVGSQQNVITNLKNPIRSVGMKCPLGKNALSNVKTQRSLLQVAKVTIPVVIQNRGAATAGDHVRLWQLERLLSATLIPLLPGIFLVNSKVLETVCAGIVVIHTYWGIEAIIADYLRPEVVGKVVPKVAHISLNVLSAIVLAGLFVLIYSGDGIANAVKKGWAIGKDYK